MTASATFKTIARTLAISSALLAASTLAERATAQTTATIVQKHIYPSIESARLDVRNAFAKARREHKRVLLDFGGDWCGDCQVLDIYFNQSPNAQLLAKHFIKVNVNIGREDANLDIAKQYGVPVHGVPALAVVEPNGTVVVSQDKEFADMRHMQATSVTEFLNKWKR